MTIARFTPSILDGETLEQLFVHRHHLLDDVLAAVREAADGDGRRHRLFIGPRGAGKTHLISLVNHRVRQAQQDGLHVGLSWLMEDPWEIETYDDLVEQILEQAGADPSGGERGLLGLAAEQGPIVVLIENLDQVFDQIGADGQRQLRALLENDRPLLIVATSTRLSNAMSGQPSPFYGFFDTTQLQPFTVGQAADMLRQLAEYSDDEALAALLALPHANARLSTIGHLAGGQPRVWALLGAGLTDSATDEMTDMLLARFDDLTPYYQEQLGRLSPSERKAVRRLADADRPLNVRNLAELARTDQRSMAKTVSELRARGWVRKYDSVLTINVDARRSYYELAEPLARIAFQMKAARGAPVRLIVDFLSTWFDAEELIDDASGRSEYRQAARQQMTMAKLLSRVLTDPGGAPVRKTGMDSLLVRLDRALAAFETRGDSSLLLSQPAAISSLVSQRLAAVDVIDLRLHLCEFAVKQQSALDHWCASLEELASRTSGARHVRALVSLIIGNSVASNTPRDVRPLVGQLDGEFDAMDDRAVRDPLVALLVGATYLRVNSGLLQDLLNMRVMLRSVSAESRAVLGLGATTALAREKNYQSALTLAKAERLRARASGSEGAIFCGEFAVATALVHVGQLAEALSCIDALRHLDSSDAMAELIGRLEQTVRARQSESHPDRMPDGLRFGEGLEPGEAGVRGP